MLYIIFIIILITVSRHYGLKNVLEAIVFSVTLFILLMGLFQCT